MYSRLCELFPSGPRLSSDAGHSRCLRSALTAAALAVLAGWVGAQGATGASRDEPLTFEAGQMRIDNKRKVRILSGGVELRRADFSLQANEVELRDQGNGQWAVATGSAARPATFRQQREGTGETVEGQADRIEYETTSRLVRLVGKAQVRRLKGSTLAEEVTGQTIVYDQERETVEVQGASPGGAGGRVRGVVTPARGESR